MKEGPVQPMPASAVRGYFIFYSEHNAEAEASAFLFLMGAVGNTKANSSNFRK